MTKSIFSAPRRDREFCADQPARPTIIRQCRHLWRRLFSHNRRTHVRHLTDHLARDIGLGQNDMARHRHVWPSESNTRPPV